MERQKTINKLIPKMERLIKHIDDQFKVNKKKGKNTLLELKENYDKIIVDSLRNENINDGLPNL